jgi:hypothetical protein
MDATLVRWCDPTGRDLPAFPQRGERIGDVSVLRREIDSVARGVDEAVYVRLPITVPPSGIQDYPIGVRVVADGADGDACVEFPLRVGRSPHG